MPRSSPLGDILSAGHHRWPLGTLQILRFYDCREFRIVFINTEIHSFGWKDTKCYRCTKLPIVHLLISRIYEYVTLHGKRDFEVGIKLKTLRWRNYVGYLGWPNLITWGIKESFFPVGRGKLTTEERIRETAVEEALSPHHCRLWRWKEG